MKAMRKAIYLDKIAIDGGGGYFVYLFVFLFQLLIKGRKKKC